MKISKLNPIYIVSVTLLITICALLIRCNNEVYDGGDEIVQVNYATIKSRNWYTDKADILYLSNFNSKNGYYWADYSNFEQFEEIVKVSMDFKTYTTLKRICSNIKELPLEQLESYREKYPATVYYSNCNAVLLILNK